nr:MAG TPA: MqsA [Caudoviricetes sp.]
MNIDLKQYLMRDFPDSKYKNTSLIRLYELDNEYYKALVKKGKILPEAITFFATKSKDVKQIGRGNIEALKSMGYESLINQYLEECAATERKKEEERLRKEEELRKAEEERIHKEEERKVQELAKKQQAAKEKKERKKKLIQEAVKAAAPKIIEARKEAIERSERKRERDKERKTQEAAAKKAKFEEARRKKEEKETIKKEEQRRKLEKEEALKRGIKPQKVTKRFCKIHKVEMSVYTEIILRTGKQIPVYNCPMCFVLNIYTYRDHDIRERPTPCYVYGKDIPSMCPKCGFKLIRTDEYAHGETGYRCLKYCDKCRIFFTPYEIYQQDINGWELLNPNESKKIGNQMRQEEQKRISRGKNAERKIQAIAANFQKDSGQSDLSKVKIEFRDFVVRRSVFQCKKSGHNLRNITGIVKIMNKAGGTEEVSVPAGHCPMCNRYFIMEDTYQSLKFKGTILCRVSDERTYLSSSSDEFDTSGMAQRSVLKQCGYSVSENSYLTSDGRKKLLCMIIDNGILDNTTIISYLRWFIRTREGQAGLQNAIEKWRSDLNFIRERYSDSWDSYRARSISR